MTSIWFEQKRNQKWGSSSLLNIVCLSYERIFNCNFFQEKIVQFLIEDQFLM